MQPVTVFKHVSFDKFHNEIRPLNQPALMRGLIDHWPSLKLAQQSDLAIANYIKTCDLRKPTNVILGAPAIKGDFFYSNGTQGVNFQQGDVTISEGINRLLEQQNNPHPYSIYVQSAPVQTHLPRFHQENLLSLLDPAITPRIWIGNALRAQTHYDLFENIACLVAGKRRFTLFPPEQLPNLYPGPFEKTLAGTPVSMVSLENPDFEQYPRFKLALDTALYADMEPGDSLYVPYFWWHHVRSFETFNVLINYWWNDASPKLGSPYDVMLHALLSIRDLPKPQLEVWKMMFDYYVFGTHGDPVAHLAETDKGALGTMGSTQTKALQQLLVNSLIKQWDN